MNENIKISIVLPSLNVKKYISQCIQSVINQSLKDIEIICVDAGSTDGTVDILNKFAASDDRITVLHSDIKSYGRQVNMGIDHAHGEYIGIVETDDYIEPFMYENLYDIANKYKDGGITIDVIKGIFNEVTNGRKSEIEMALYSYPKDYSDKIIYDLKNSDAKFYAGFHIWSGIYRTEFMKSNNIRLHESEGASYQDVGFEVIIQLYADTEYLTNLAVYNYRLDNEESSTNNMPQKYHYLVDEYKWLYEELSKKKILNESAEKFINVLKFQSYYLIFTILKNNLGARDGFIESIKTELLSGSFDSEFCNNYIKGFKLKYKALTGNRDAINILDEFDNTGSNAYEQYSDWINDSEQIVIFGTGNIGKQLIYLHDRYYNSRIACMCDNNALKQGTYFENKYQIISPKQAADKYPGATFFIANKYYFSEMRNQLIGYGIPEEQIRICNNVILSR